MKRRDPIGRRECLRVGVQFVYWHFEVPYTVASYELLSQSQT